MKRIAIEKDSVVLTVNPKLYPIEVVYSASYVFLDKAYILLDGDPEREVLIRLKPKKQTDLEILGREFMNELVNYADYRERAKETKAIREAILQRALITNDPGIMPEETISEEDTEFESILKGLEEDNEDAFEDPEGIAIPWEEKYGKKTQDENEKESNNKTK